MAEAKFSLSHKLSKELTREAEALHVDLEDYITDILIDRHKLQIINQTKTMETLISKVDQLINHNKPKTLPINQSLIGLLSNSVCNALAESNVVIVADLMNLRYSEIAKLPGIGKVALKAIDEFMTTNHLSYRG